MKILVTIIILTIFISVGAAAYLILSERKSNSFDNYQSVTESGLIEKGWIPSFIPKSSYNINEQHVIDKPDIHVEFYFEPEDISFFNKACKIIRQNMYICTTSDDTVKVKITNDNHAVIESM